MLWAFFQFLWPSWGWLGIGGIALLGFVSARRLFQGCAAGEVRNMIVMRHKRTAVWLLLLGAVAAALYFIEIEDRSSGPFQVRSATRAELRASAAGFLKEVYFDVRQPGRDEPHRPADSVGARTGSHTQLRTHRQRADRTLR